jgi:ribonuclease HI
MKTTLEYVYKINVDASFRAETKKGGWGFIVRNKKVIFLT